jgi:hypothetical protein
MPTWKKKTWGFENFLLKLKTCQRLHNRRRAFTTPNFRNERVEPHITNSYGALQLGCWGGTETSGPVLKRYFNDVWFSQGKLPRTWQSRAQKLRRSITRRAARVKNLSPTIYGSCAEHNCKIAMLSTATPFLFLSHDIDLCTGTCLPIHKKVNATEYSTKKLQWQLKN